MGELSEELRASGILDPLEPGDVVVSLTRGLVAVVSPEHAEIARGFSWHASTSRCGYYARRGHDIYLHRAITGAPPGMHADHRNRCTLDCRSWNLVVCTPTRNYANRTHPIGMSGYRGVYPDRGRWRARGTDPEGERVELGRFDDPAEAARQRDRWMVEQYGPFVVLNFPWEFRPVHARELAAIREEAPWRDVPVPAPVVAPPPF